jgi:hypothetical protein
MRSVANWKKRIESADEPSARYVDASRRGVFIKFNEVTVSFVFESSENSRPFPFDTATMQWNRLALAF